MPCRKNNLLENKCARAIGAMSNAVSSNDLGDAFRHLIIMLTVGVNLAHNDAGLAAAVPFIAATALVAALPVLAYLLFRRRAQRLMPRVRDWMNADSWLVNIIAYVVFIALIL
jgi:hypothetical protein